MPEITANSLRQLAESADGQRGRPLHLVFRNGALELTDAPGETDQGTGIVVNTTPVRLADANKLSAVFVQKTPNSTPMALPEETDAIFWNESAVAKFVIPYYSRLLEPTDLEKIARTNRDPRVYAIAHCCRSVGHAITDAQDMLRIVHDNTAADPNSPFRLTSLREWGQ